MMAMTVASTSNVCNFCIRRECSCNIFYQMRFKQTTTGLIVEDSDSPTHYNNNSRLFFRAVADSQDHWNLICNMQSTTTTGLIIHFELFFLLISFSF